MPIAKPAQVIQPKQPVLQRDNTLVPEKPLAVDTRYEPRRHLLTHLSGAKWLVNYYKQLKTEETASEAFNYHRPLPYQQYMFIERLELRVTTPLTESYDEENAAMTVTGASIVPPSIVPDNGDHFLADIGDGRTGFFHIKTITQKSYFKDTTYEIEYELIDYLSNDLKKALDACVVNEGHFVRSYSDYGANPVLTNTQYDQYNKLQKWQVRMARHYFDSFFSTEYNTFLIPVPGMVIYDPYIVEFIAKIWDTEMVPQLDMLRVYARDNKDNLIVKTLWDAMVNMDPYMLAKVKTKFGVIPRRAFPTGLAAFGSFTYSRIDYIYHPIDSYDPISGEVIIPNIGPLNVKEHVSKFSIDRSLSLPMTKLPGLGFVYEQFKEKEKQPDAKKFGTYDTYLLSPAFYNGKKEEMSKLEAILYGAFNDQPVNACDLLPILEDSINWGEMERFYYIPLLTVLTRCALGDLSR